MIYGNSFAGDALWSIRIGLYGTKASFRFIAKNTVPVNKIRYFNTYSFTKPGYHGGNGGKIKVEIRENGNNNNPSDSILTTAYLEKPLESPAQVLLTFDKTIILTSGKIYHIVFSNYDANPEVNYTSVDMMAVMTPKTPEEKFQPELSNIDMTTLHWSRYNDWQLFKPNLTMTPIFSLFYDIDETRTELPSVIGYGGMESWIREPRSISYGKRVRQNFIPERDIKVRNFAVRIAKNGNPDMLIATLSDTNQTTLAVGGIESTNINKINTEYIPGFRVGHNWAVCKFGGAIKLKAGQRYYLTLSCSSNDGYEVFPIRDGEEFGYVSIWPNSYAEYEISGFDNWVGWDAWGKSNLRTGILQIYFNSTLTAN